jgi:hypothetical protein
MVASNPVTADRLGDALISRGAWHYGRAVTR